MYTNAQSVNGDSTKLLEQMVDTEALFQIKDLELRVRLLMDGLWKGLHKSSLHGFSAEFTEYRAYTQGDDLRYLDWKLYGRSKRFYIKKFLEETNLRSYVILDQTKSMTFKSLDYDKWDYARTLAATWLYFLNLQRDSVGLITFDKAIRNYFPARSRPGHLRQLLIALSQEAGGLNADLQATLQSVVGLVRKRSLFILISDFLFPLDSFEKELQMLSALRHPTVVLQVLDPQERSFEFQTGTLFQDLETDERVFVDPTSLKEKYQAKLGKHQARLSQICQNSGVHFISATTNEPLSNVMIELIRTRALNVKKTHSRAI